MTGNETRVHFAAPQGSYLGWFSQSPKLFNNVWEPNAKPREVNSVVIKMSDETVRNLEVSDYGTFTITVQGRDEFRPCELLVMGSQAFEGRLYLHLRPGK